MIKKQHYETPETEFLEVRFEGNLLTGTMNVSGMQKGNNGLYDYDDLDQQS